MKFRFSSNGTVTFPLQFNMLDSQRYPLNLYLIIDNNSVYIEAAAINSCVPKITVEFISIPVHIYLDIE